MKGTAVRVSAILFVALLLVGCGSQPAAPAAAKAKETPAVDPAQPAAAEVSFAKDVQSLVHAHCLPCHSGAPNATAPFDWTTYDGIVAHVVPGNPNSSKFYQMLRDGRMPPGSRLDTAKIGVVYRWISEGAKNN
jgi:uncharacterized membrane protein